MLLSGIAAAKSPHPRPLKARTHFLATSTCIRGTWGTNEDIYLAEITVNGRDKTLVRLIDEYPDLQPPMSHESLTSSTGTEIWIKRDSECDIAYANMKLRTAPGDPMVILHERLKYQPQMDNAPAPDTNLPCYRTVRR
jgi:hypothetical protein